MADSLLNTVKQGSQLFKESSEAVSGLSEKAGLPKAPTSPMETAVIGGSPSQAKMAGTPAALKARATAPKIASSLKLATQERQAQADPELAAEQKRALELSQKLSGLGSLGKRVPDLINKAVNDQLQGVKVKPVVDTAALASLNLSAPDQSALTDSLNVLADPSQPNDKQQEAMVTVSNLTKQDLSKMDPTTLSTTVQGFFKKGTAANLEAAVSTATPASVTLGMLGDTPDALGYNSWDSLATDLGLKVPEGKSAQDVLKGMSIKELGQTVDTIKRTGFQTQQEWMSVLQDPTSSLQDRQVARTMLTNMGASGVREAEQRTATLTAQVQAGNTVTVNLTGTPQTMSVEDVLKNDTTKGAIAVLLDPTKPGYKEVAEANPELLKWVTDNAAVLKDQVKGISDDVSQFATNNAANAKILNTFFPDEKARNAIGNVLFPGTWGTFSAQKYDLAKAPLLQNWTKIPAGEQAQISAAIQTIADGGTAEDIQAFMNTNRDALKSLKLDTPAGVASFQNFWAEQKLIRSIQLPQDITTVENANSVYLDLTGESKDKLTQDAATQAALGPLGFKSASGLTLTPDLKSATKGMSSVNMKDLLNSGKPPVSLKDQIASVNKEMENFAATATDPAIRALATAITQKHGPLSDAEVKALVTSAGLQDNVAAMHTLEDRTGVKLVNQIATAATNQFNTELGTRGFPKLSEMVGNASADPSKTQGYLDKLNSMLGSADKYIQQDIKDQIGRLEGLRTTQQQQQKQAAEDQEARRWADEQKKSRDKFWTDTALRGLTPSAPIIPEATKLYDRATKGKLF